MGFNQNIEMNIYDFDYLDFHGGELITA